MDLDFVGAIMNASPPGPFCLVAGNYYGRFGVANMPFQICKYPAPIHHTAACDHDLWPAISCQLFSIFVRANHFSIFKYLTEYICPQFVPLIIFVKYLAYISSHRGIEVYRNVGNIFFLFKFPEEVHKILGPVNGKAGDDQNSVSFTYLLKDINKLLFIVYFGVKAISIS